MAAAHGCMRPTPVGTTSARRRSISAPPPPPRTHEPAVRFVAALVTSWSRGWEIAISGVTLRGTVLSAPRRLRRRRAGRVRLIWPMYSRRTRGYAPNSPPSASASPPEQPPAARYAMVTLPSLAPKTRRAPPKSTLPKPLQLLRLHAMSSSAPGRTRTCDPQHVTGCATATNCRCGRENERNTARTARARPERGAWHGDSTATLTSLPSRPALAAWGRA